MQTLALLIEASGWDVLALTIGIVLSSFIYGFIEGVASVWWQNRSNHKSLEEQ